MSNGTDVNIIIRAIDQTQTVFQQIRQSLGGLQGHTSGAVASSNQLGSSIATLRGGIAALGATVAGLSIASVFQKGIESVDDFQQSVIKTAALISSLQGGDAPKVAENYKLAKEYAYGLQDTLMEVDAKTTLNLSNLQAITEEMIKQGVRLDYNNKEQVEGFTALANAVAVYSRNGKDAMQVRQEVAALLRGEVDANSQLASMVQKMVDGPLRDQVSKWKQSDEFLTQIGGKLSGFKAAADDLGGTWGAISSTMETIASRILRGGFAPIVKELVDYGQTFAEYLKEHQEVISGKVTQAWMMIRGIVEGVIRFFKAMSPELQVIAQLVGAIAKGWLFLGGAVFPVIMDRLGNIIGSMMSVGEAFWAMVNGVWQLLSGNVSGAQAWFKKANELGTESGKRMGEGLRAGFLDEVGEKWDKIEKAGTPATDKKARPDAPDLGAMKVDPKQEAKNRAAAAKAAALKRKWDDIYMELEGKDQGPMDEFEKRKEALTMKVGKLMNDPGADQARLRKALADGLAKIDLEAFAAMSAEADKQASEELTKFHENEKKMLDAKREFESAMTAATGSELAKRNAEADEWGRKQLELFEQTDIETWEQYEAGTKRIKESVDKRKALNAGEIGLKTAMSDIDNQLAGIDLKASLNQISPDQVVEQKIPLLERQLTLQKEYQATLTGPENEQAWIAERNAIQQTQEQLAKLKQTQLERSSDMGAGFSSGIAKWMQSVQSGFQMMQDLAQTAASGIANIMSTGLFDVLTGKVTNFREQFKGLVDSMLKMVIQFMMNQMVMKFLTMIGFSMVGAAPAGGAAVVSHDGGYWTKYHSGGYVIPKFHAGGLASDEIPAILQSGEGVVSRRGMRALDSLNQGTIGGDVQVNAPINVSVTGGSSGGDKDGERYGQLGKMLKAAVLQVIQEEQRPGGLLAGAR